MSATFNCTAVYQVEATCQTPLRTGGSEGNIEHILQDSYGNAFLQGSSLAGAMRAWWSEQKGCTGDLLFGSQKCQGKLTVSDGVFFDQAKYTVRPRVKISGKTGTVENKFDVAHIFPGAKMQFTLVWLGDKNELAELSDVETMLSAMHHGEICLGAQKTNGFGRVSLSVKKRQFDLTNEKDRTAWLADEWTGTPMKLPDLENTSQVIFIVTGHADSILVKGSAPEAREGADGTSKRVTVNINENGKNILPGSSIKGAVRARTYMIADILGLEKEWVNTMFGRGSDGVDNGLAGRIRFEDVVLSDKGKRENSRIRINRLTGGVIRKGLFTEESLSSDITLRIVAPDDSAQCALLLFALRDLGLGLYQLGSGGSIGRGYIMVQEIESTSPDGRKAYLSFDNHHNCSLDDPNGLISEWTHALGGMTHEN